MSPTSSPRQPATSCALTDNRSSRATISGCAQLRLRDSRMTCQVLPLIGSAFAPAMIRQTYAVGFDSCEACSIAARASLTLSDLAFRSLRPIGVTADNGTSNYRPGDVVGGY